MQDINIIVTCHEYSVVLFPNQLCKACNINILKKIIVVCKKFWFEIEQNAV